MFEQKLLDLVKRLHVKTAGKQLNWEQSFYNDQAFETNLGPYSVRIGPRFDPDYPESPDYFVQVVGENNRVLEEFSNVTLRGLEAEGSVQPYRLLDETYRLARRQALGAEDAIDNLLKDLGGAS